MAYLLDANVFIQAKNLHYGLDFCSAFWDWLIEANQRGSVYSIEKGELAKKPGGRPLFSRDMLITNPAHPHQADLARQCSLLEAGEDVGGQG